MTDPLLELTDETETQARRLRMRGRMERLYPMLRSLTGNGVRDTLAVIREAIPIATVRIPSGADAYDWTVNDEWNVAEAYVADTNGRRVVDVADHTLHVVGYSAPIRARMTLDELRPHLHALPDHPDWIPFRTSFYARDWGFCLAQRQLDALSPGDYDVVVDATLEPGELVYGELLVPGEGDEEVLVTSHVCHPSLANDNLSGITVAVELAMAVAGMPRRRYGYRFVFAPGTIGSITWLSRNPDVVARIRHGLVLTGLGGGGPLVYKRTRNGARTIDHAAAHVVGRHGGQLREYSPWGYDERQFNSLGFDLPVGRLTRTPHGEYPEYHTSADDLGFVSDAELDEALMALVQIVEVIEHDANYVNLSPHGEPQLGRRGLYPSVGGTSAPDVVMAMLWVLGYSDGTTSLLKIAETADLDFATIRHAALALEGGGLVSRVDS